MTGSWMRHAVALVLVLSPTVQDGRNPTPRKAADPRRRGGERPQGRGAQRRVILPAVEPLGRCYFRAVDSATRGVDSATRACCSSRTPPICTRGSPAIPSWTGGFESPCCDNSCHLSPLLCTHLGD